MNKVCYALALLAFALAGCDFSFLSPAGGPGSAANVRDVASEDATNAESPARDSPAAAGRPITLRIINAEQRDAQCRVMMTLAGQQVHFSFRKILAGTRAVVIGPDQADEIRVEATFLGDSPVALDAQVLRMGRDYAGGDLIDVTLRLPVEQEGGGSPPPPPPPPPPAEPTVAVAGLDSDVTVEVGEVVSFAVETSDTPDGATVAALADPDDDPTNGNEITIVSGVPAADRVAVSWDTNGITAGTYTIYGVLAGGATELLSEPAPGRVIVSEPPPPPPAPTIALRGLDLDARVNPGAVIGFDVLTTDAPEGATFSVYADSAGSPKSNTGPIPIVVDVPAAATVAVSWDTTDVPAGTYTVFAELNVGDETIASDTAPGQVTINALPTLQILTPIDGFVANVSEFFHVTWDGSDPDDDASVTIFLDADGVLNGNELILAENLSEDDPAGREVIADIFAVARGFYYVGGTISDSLATVTTIGPRICVARGRIGAFEALTLPVGEVCVITPDPNTAPGWANAFGTSLDISADLAGDGIADLLIGDPATAWDNEGGAYYHANPSGVWPHDLSTTDLQVYVLGQQIPGSAGQSVAFVGPIDPNDAAAAEVVVGDPLESYAWTDSAEGAARFYSGDTILNAGGTVWPEDGTALLGDDPGQNTGARVVALGDVNGDGRPDVGVGAPGHLYADPNEPVGQVAIIFSGQPLPDGNLSDVGATIAGVRLIGENVEDLTGAAIVDAGELSQARGHVSSTDILIGAPGADGGRGKAYLVLGESISGARVVALADQGTQWNGTVFLGEEPDLPPKSPTTFGGAGSALAVLDFDGDGRRDIVIGAPGFDRTRGRVYIVYNTWIDGLPQTIRLADVGTAAVPGVRITGSGDFDEFGYSLANAGDLDGDGLPDLAIGAPGVAESRGAVYVIYGGQALDPELSAGDIGACGVQGWIASGSAVGEAFGAALAGGGDLDGDGLPDLAVGAPYFYPLPNEEFMTGRAMLLLSPPVTPPTIDDE